MVSEASVHNVRTALEEQSSSPHGRQKPEEREIEEGARTRYNPKDTPPVTCFFQVGPSSCLSPLPIMSSCFESIKRLIHSLGQSLNTQ
jgi:hypothetical protein